MLPGITLHRLNAAYAPTLGLCRLVLRHLTLQETVGTHPFASFLVDMPRLYESFVTARLRAALPAYGLRVVAQRSDFLDEARSVGIRPDVLVYRMSGRRPVLVLDAKYRRADQGDLNRDLYQVSAYLDRYELGCGVLVYPRFGEEGHTELRVRGTPKRLHLAILDLAAPTPAALEESCAALSQRVADLARGR
jgi:5-methylcytosine-specific restriction enzyme subunit McrC